MRSWKEVLFCCGTRTKEAERKTTQAGRACGPHGIDPSRVFPCPTWGCEGNSACRLPTCLDDSWGQKKEGGVRVRPPRSWRDDEGEEEGEGGEEREAAAPSNTQAPYRHRHAHQTGGGRECARGKMYPPPKPQSARAGSPFRAHAGDDSAPQQRRVLWRHGRKEARSQNPPPCLGPSELHLSNSLPLFDPAWSDWTEPSLQPNHPPAHHDHARIRRPPRPPPTPKAGYFAARVVCVHCFVHPNTLPYPPHRTHPPSPLSPHPTGS